MNNDGMLDIAERVITRRTGKKSLVNLSRPSMGGEDFADYLKYIPGCFIYVGTRNGAATSYPWHHPKFDLDEQALSGGAETLAAVAMAYLKEA